MLRRVLSNLMRPAWQRRYEAAKRQYDEAFAAWKGAKTDAAQRVQTRGYGQASKTLQNELHAALGRKPQ